MKKQFPLSIVAKVSILAGGIAAFASLIVGSLILSGSSDIVYENALDRLRYEADTKAVRLLSDIRNLSGDANYLAATPPVQGIPRATSNGGIDPLDQSTVEVWKNRLQTIFAELIRAKPNYLQIRYIGVADNGRELIRVDRRGQMIQILPTAELQQKGDTSYFKNAAKRNPGEIYLSDITLNREFDVISEPHIAVIRAARSVFFDGKLYGIIVINMSFDGIFGDLVQNTPRELIPYVANESGYFLAHPKSGMTYGFDLDKDIRIQSQFPEFDRIASADRRDTDFTIAMESNVLHIVKAHFDPSRPDRFLAVMVATSYETLEAGASALQFQSILIIAFLVIVSLILAAVLTSRLMSPLNFISIAADDLAHGREVTDLPLDANNEIGELARSFDVMRNQLVDKEHELIISQGLVHHANKMSSLGEMAAGMAHEINSPIQTISLIAERVQRQLNKGTSNEEINGSMSEITASVDKISEVIDSLRKVSRDSVDDEYAETRIGDLVRDMSNMTYERMKVNDVKFEIKYNGVSENALLQCQCLQISQVLINLVNNAYDAIKLSNDKWITIDIKKISQRIQIAVTDSGSGIPCDIADRIFEPMFTTKDIGSGTGLGLSISKEIVSKHNGMLYFDEEAANTRFVLELPVVHVGGGYGQG